MDQLSRAIAITAKGFENVTDKGHEPYILHCLRVMSSLNTKDRALQAAAVLHDVVEDRIYTLNDLRSEGFSERVIDYVDVLTRREDEPYDHYIQRVQRHSGNAIAIKLADLEDNLRVSRLMLLKEKDLNRLAEYLNAYQYLLS